MMMLWVGNWGILAIYLKPEFYASGSAGSAWNI